MPFHTDQLNRTVELSSPPNRIISLVPSQTELLCDLGLEKETIGITKFCVHPEKWFREKVRIGGTKNVDFDKIASLRPDLIIANKEENVQEQIEELAKKYPVWVSDVNNLNNAFSMIECIGEITHRKQNAEVIVKQIKVNFAGLQFSNPKPLTAYLIWKDPYMTIGGDTFINDMMDKAGFQNVFADRLRYPQTTMEELQYCNCEVLLLSSEPYPFKKKHIAELQRHLQHTKIVLADGEMFSWYGSRLLHVPVYFKSLQEQIAAMP